MGNLDEVFLNIVSCFSTVCEKCGVYTLLRKYTSCKVIILMIHGVSLKSEGVAHGDYKHIDAQKFEQSLQYLVKNYTILALNDFLDWKLRRKKDLPKNSVIITFDDGYKNMYTTAYPILKKYKVPATIFLPTEYIDKKKVAWYDLVTYCIAHTTLKKITFLGKEYSLTSESKKKEAIFELKVKVKDLFPLDRQRALKELILRTKVDPKKCTDENFLFLTWQECKEMEKGSISFEPHSVTHPVLTELSKQEILKEMTESKRCIEKHLKKKCRAFAYPFGEYDITTLNALRKVGYDAGLTTQYGKNTQQTNTIELQRIALSNRYQLPLIWLTLSMNFPRMHYLVSQKYMLIKNGLMKLWN